VQHLTKEAVLCHFGLLVNALLSQL
jgi:hypothetical protein